MPNIVTIRTQLVTPCPMPANIVTIRTQLVVLVAATG